MDFPSRTEKAAAFSFVQDQLVIAKARLSRLAFRLMVLFATLGLVDKYNS